jgi:membrane protein YqaA with SNARE-associated domain
MEFITRLIDLFLHLDKHLNDVISQYGGWTYLILFLIVFCETGLVVTPILPGDSLLFAAGTFAALGSLNVLWVFVLLSIAAIAGDTINYWVGYWIGPKIFHRENVRFLNRRHLERTHAFLRKVWRQDNSAGSLCSHCQNFCAVCRRHRQNELLAVSLPTTLLEALDGWQYVFSPATTLAISRL